MIPTGTHINYYFICHRKLWLFSHGVQCEMESDAVRMGKHIHETSYEREDKEIAIDGRIVLDWFDAERGVVHEVKKSDKMEEAHVWQICFYLWYLKEKGMAIAQREHDEGITGELNYPMLKSKKTVILTTEKERELTRDIIPEIEAILAAEVMPGAVEWKVCKSCAYCELCHS